MHLGTTEAEALKQGGASDDELGMIENFKRRVAEFTSVFNALISSGPPKDPVLLAEYNRLIGRGTTIQNTIVSLMNAINKAVTWVKATFGLNSLNDGQLGFFWLIPVAGITAALALIGKFISDAYIYSEKTKAFKDLVADKRMTPQAAADVIAKTYGSSGGLFSSIGNLGLPLIILGVSYYLITK